MDIHSKCDLHIAIGARGPGSEHRRRVNYLVKSQGLGGQLLLRFL